MLSRPRGAGVRLRSARMLLWSTRVLLWSARMLLRSRLSVALLGWRTRYTRVLFGSTVLLLPRLRFVGSGLSVALLRRRPGSLLRCGTRVLVRYRGVIRMRCGCVVFPGGRMGSC